MEGRKGRERKYVKGYLGVRRDRKGKGVGMGREGSTWIFVNGSRVPRYATDPHTVHSPSPMLQSSNACVCQTVRK